MARKDNERSCPPEQLFLIPHICDVEDDVGVRCKVEMTQEEIDMDGMCERCAFCVFDSDDGVPFIIKNPNTREF